eukprot:CAMPEP_0194386750 /NCGR_PEP_ID=MMETSP0174-20130528/88281_1 /TAXON_ID=216777 /ORGANISM="Proboscia alata, Strain PI-D3" /LENGTH=70 /DNA_ID=CAMNT_0039176271 /DNA_START=135 /DNA_END=344 /DNA_ORIENTATION=+
MTKETYMYLMEKNNQAFEDKKLLEAFWYLRFLNDKMYRQFGDGDAFPLYGIACCCSRLAETHHTENEPPV